MPCEPVPGCTFFSRDALRRIARKMLERHDDFLGLRIESDSCASEHTTRNRYGQGQPEGTDMTPEGLRENMEQPAHRSQAVRFFPGLVYFRVGAGDQGLEKALNFSLGGKCCEL